MPECTSLILYLLLMNLSLTGFSQNPPRKATKVTLGIMPDYWYNINGTGLRVKGIISGRPAEAAGIKAGDIILSMNTSIIKNIFSYQDALSSYNTGDTVTLVIMRETSSFSAKAVFR